MNVAIYCRVSTTRQELDQQIEVCRRYCEFKRFENPTVFAEVGTGKNFNRPALQELIKLTREGRFNAIVAFRFDRLGRNAREIVLLFDEFESKGVAIYSVHENLDTTTPIGRAMREILIILAQLERENIAEATRQRLQALKNLGKTLGRPANEIDLKAAQAMRATGLSWAFISRSLGYPASTIRSQLKALRKREADKTPQNQEGTQPPANIDESHKP